MNNNLITFQMPDSVGRVLPSILFLSIVILFRVILELCFTDFVVPVYEHEGYNHSVNPVKYAESWVLFFLLLVMIPQSVERPSHFYLNYFFLCFFAPLLILFGLSDSDRTFIYYAVFVFIIIRVVSTGRYFQIPRVKQGRAVLSVVISFFLISVTGWMFVSGGLSLFNLDLMRVYDFRDEAGGLIDVGPMAYANTWSTNVIGPAAFAVALLKRKFFVALLLLSLFVLWFGINTHKSVLFFPVVAIFLWAWLSRSSWMIYLPAALCVVLGGGLWLSIIFDNNFIGGMLIRRVFFVPPMLALTYFDFFSTNNFVFWSSSVLSDLIDYPYFTEPAKLIGHHLGWNAHANNSFLATGFMHAGFLGMALYGVVIGVIFKLIDSMTRYRLPVWVALSVTFGPMHTLLINADLLTSLLSHGLGLAVMLLLFFNLHADDKS